ncbi:hypothetical protein EW026_g2928 [Hermanssonia centrifuga]|uniref:Uncharacterized protein n=1 Tax=Hermanssonia centrifuga TaxID=98765 RepID=A0A4S4KLS5_9APHY|nr:hypothetical protein EW026_g2928 [Hermanssonia centrifuga]
MLRSYQGEDNSFDSWVESLENTNALLVGTTAAFSELQMREHIKSHSVADLRVKVETAEVKALIDFQEFREVLSEADIQRHRDRTIRKHEIESLIAATARSQPTLLSRPPVSSSSVLAGGGSAGALANSRRTGILPKLTTDEKKLLEDQRGCFKCRKLNAGHLSKACTNGFPNATTYHNLVTGKQTIAAISATTLEDFNNLAVEPTPIVAVSHAVASCVLSSGNDDWSSDSEYVLPTLSLPHILWNARLHTFSGLSDSVPMLIDSGSTIVLIREDLAISLNLPRCNLHKLFHYKGTFGEDVWSATKCCKLRVSTINSSWMSITVRAIIVPELCSPVILGLPFHAINKLFIDPENHTLIVKSTGRDLLQPGPVASPCNTCPKSVQQREKRIAEQAEQELVNETETLEQMFLDLQRNDMVKELKLRFGERGPSSIVGLTHDEIVASIQQRIDELTLADLLTCKNKTM